MGQAGAVRSRRAAPADVLGEWGVAWKISPVFRRWPGAHGSSGAIQRHLVGTIVATIRPGGHYGFLESHPGSDRFQRDL